MLLRLLQKAFGVIISTSKMTLRKWRANIPVQASSNVGEVKASQQRTSYGSFLDPYCKEQNRYMYCGYCEKGFFTPAEGVDHARQHNYYCSLCGIEAHFYTLGLLVEHYGSAEHVRKSTRANAGLSPTPVNVENHLDRYKTLRISPCSARHQVVEKANETRIDILPDRLKRQGGLTKEQQKIARDLRAALVGQVLDILSEQDLYRILSTVQSHGGHVISGRCLRNGIPRGV